MARPRKQSENQPQAELTVKLLKLADGPVFFAESTNGPYTQSVPFLLGHGQALRIKEHIPGAGIGKLQHKAGGADHFAADGTLLPGQLHIGVNGIFQGIGQDDGQPKSILYKRTAAPTAAHCPRLATPRWKEALKHCKSPECLIAYSTQNGILSCLPSCRRTSG